MLSGARIRGKPHLLVGLLSAVAMAGGLLNLGHAQQRHVLLLEVDGIISPVTEGFIARGVERAEAEGASLIIVHLDTPGGLLGLYAEDYPTLAQRRAAVGGVRGTSRGEGCLGGTFITAAATFAVMAPGTNVGAASPVSGDGEELPETLRSKVTNDAAAEMRTIAELRGRNQEKLEATVLQALSFTGEEAVESGMVDFLAGDLDDLLAQLHGREATVRPPGGPRLVLETQGVAVQTMEMSLVERFLRFLSDPNVSYLLLSLGSLGIFLELLNPGLIVPGVTGLILLILSYVTLGNLPVNWAGVVAHPHGSGPSGAGGLRGGLWYPGCWGHR